MKNLVMIALVICFGTAVTFAQADMQQPQVQTIGAETELIFKDVAKEQIPVKVIDAFSKDNKEAVIYKTAVATTADDENVYRISVKDTQGEAVHYFYNEDGTKFEKEENLEE